MALMLIRDGYAPEDAINLMIGVIKETDKPFI
jgi:hypothetical protein